MNNTKNFLLAIIIMVGFFAFWETVVVKRYAPRTKVSSTAPMTTTKAATGPSTIKESPDGSVSKSNSTEDKFILLQTAQEQVKLSSQGAKVVSWQVKENSHWVELVYEGMELSPLLPLETFPELNFSAIKATDQEARFTAIHPAGFEVTKTILLDTSAHLHTISLVVKNRKKSESVTVNTNLAWHGGLDKKATNEDFSQKKQLDAHKKKVVAEMQALALAGRVKTWKPGFLFGRTIDYAEKNNFKWIGAQNSHFLAALVGNPTPIDAIVVNGDHRHPPTVQVPIQVELKPGESKEWSYQLYVGPKEIRRLQEADHDLNKAVNYGWLGFIGKMLLMGLTFFHTLTGNYGWAIVLLTICFQILVFPLTRKSLQHSIKMRELQPEMKKIQAQHRDDPKRLQIEQLNLYRRHGMKLMGFEGCLPMMIQIPIFIAYYQTLAHAYALRGAPWIFWIKDLGSADPKHVLPVLMGLGMFLQQKLSSVPMDPAQEKMMLLMPIMFTFMFLSLPSGLVLYWCVNSIATIVIQRILQWQQPHAATTQ